HLQMRILCTMPTNTSDPSHFVVSNLDKSCENQEPLKYGIISSCSGTEIVRFCPKKMLVKDGYECNNNILSTNEVGQCVAQDENEHHSGQVKVLREYF
ncbi:hypothetical protein PMAYCL1PPCAC_09208, partial [Pristionchus mayeri]